MPSSRVLWIILVLALMVRLAAAAYWHRQAIAEGGFFRLGDSDSYWVLAGHLARGEAYQYGSENARIFRAPLLPIVLAPTTLIPDASQAVFAARVLACLLGTLAVFEVMLLAGRLAGSAAATGAGLIAACSPSAIGMSIVVLSEMLLIPLMLAHLLLWHSAWCSQDRRRTAWLAVAAGVAGGAAVLARPSWLLFAPWLLAVGLLVGPQRWKQLRIFVFFAMGLCLVMLPWWIRNARETGRFVPTTLQVGPSLFDGLHAGASGASDEGMAFMASLLALQIEEDRRATTPPPSTLEYRLNRLAQRQALGWAADNPGQVVRLALRKFCLTWSLWPNGGQLGSPAVRWTISLGTFGILLLAIFASWCLAGQTNGLLRLCWMPCLYFTLLHMVFVGSIRYREPAMLVLAALAGCAMAKLAGFDTRTHQSETGLHGSDSAPSN